MNRVIHVHHTRLTRHPHNMRLHYRATDVMEMAMSQAERVKRGQEPCVQSLVVTPGAGVRYEAKCDQRLIIVAGHLRHAGNVRLGMDAPPLNCVVHEYPDEESMLADMRTENGKRVEPSPLGWAANFRASMDADKTVRDLARESGKTVHFVETMLDLLNLAPAVQKLIDTGLLPISAIKHLKRIDDQRLQTDIAKKAAKHAAGESGVRLAVERSLAKPQAKKPPRPGVTPRPAPAVRGAPKDLNASLGDIRRSASQTCQACEAYGKLVVSEPAWHIALEASGRTCEACSIRDEKDACEACALPEMMTRIVRSLAGNVR